MLQNEDQSYLLHSMRFLEKGIEGTCLQQAACINLKLLFFFKIHLFINLAALGLRCCTRAFSSCGEQGLLFVAVCRLLIAVASLVVEHGL